MRSVPVVYVHFADAVSSASYLWSTMRLTIDQGNAVVLLTHPAVVVPADVSACLADRADAYDLALRSHAIKRLERVYMPGAKAAASVLGKIREPQEALNLKRFFVMHEYMHLKKLRVAMLLDSDASLLSHSSVIWSYMRAQQPRCSSALVAQDWRGMGQATWAHWAGTSLLSLEVLSDFLEFAVALYHPKTMAAVASAAKSKRPSPMAATHWNDMITWYLFDVAADNSTHARAVELRTFEDEYGVKLPRVARRWHLCDLTAFGINNNHIGFMGPRTDYHSRISSYLTLPGPFSMYQRELTFDRRRRFWWKNESVRSMHFWLQKSTVLEIVPAWTHLNSSCSLPDYHPAWGTMAWGKLAYVLGISGQRRTRT